jgi:hypothetical protein
VGSLSVYYLVNKGNDVFEQTTTPVWTKKGNHGSHWQFGQVAYQGGNQSISFMIIEGYSIVTNEGMLKLRSY